jgi:hypothetical protein
MARLKYMEDFQATTACTVRMLAALSLDENSLPPDKNLQRNVFGDSWFASYETMKGLREKLGLHFVGVIKTAALSHKILQEKGDPMLGGDGIVQD